MRRWLRSGLRGNACITMAMLYAMSVFMPHVSHAYALSHRTTDSAAMSQHDHGTEAAHHHPGGAAHHHATAQHPTSHSNHGGNDTDPKCCAQITLTVLPQQNVDLAFTGLSHSPDFPALVAKLTGRGADRLDRPPNV